MESKEKLRENILEKIKQLPQDKLSSLDLFLSSLENQLIDEKVKNESQLIEKFGNELLDVKSIRNGKKA